ncbi:MAG: hypothetical protein A4E28_00180 [Methanocella sp. PtaU1.Bin125]|nr:MAG: hypothetical protein A4E28_00180 [Methanocella sp. PtaU1.Bin125]
MGVGTGLIWSRLTIMRVERVCSNDPTLTYVLVVGTTFWSPLKSVELNQPPSDGL